MKLVLHIGTEKTGTSSIQSFLKANKKQFLEQGYYYLSTPNWDLFRELAVYALREGTRDDFLNDNSILTTDGERCFRAEFRTRIQSEMALLPKHIHTVIASCEHLHSRIRFEDEVESIKSLFGSYIESYQIITYLRPQIDVAVSRYSTDLKSGEAPSSNLNQYLNDTFIKHSGWYNYSTSLSIWEGAFGLDAMTVRLFSKSEFYQGDLIDDFLYVVGGESAVIIRDKCLYPRTVNESITNLGQEILLSLNYSIRKANNNSVLRQFSRKVIVVVSNVCAGKGRVPLASVAKELALQFDKSNKEVQQRYFKDKNVILTTDFKKFSIPSASVSNVPKDIFDKTFAAIAEHASEDMNVAIDIMRDAAISMEDLNIECAYVFMSVAKVLRPNGPKINKKLNEYKLKLELSD